MPKRSTILLINIYALKMKKLVLISLLIVSITAAFAQSWNPFVNQGIISPAPLLPLEYNGTGVLWQLVPIISRVPIISNPCPLQYSAIMLVVVTLYPFPLYRTFPLFNSHYIESILYFVTSSFNTLSTHYSCNLTVWA